MTKNGRRRRGGKRPATQPPTLTKLSVAQIATAADGETQKVATRRVLQSAHEALKEMRGHREPAISRANGALGGIDQALEVLDEALAKLGAYAGRLQAYRADIDVQRSGLSNDMRAFCNATNLVISCVEPDIEDEVATEKAAVAQLVARVAELEEANRKLQERLRAPQAPAPWLRRLLGSFRRPEDIPEDLWPSVVDTIMRRTLVAYFDAASRERLSAGQAAPDDTAVQDRKAAIKAALEAFDRTVGGMSPDDEPAVRLMWDIVKEYLLALGWDGKEFVAELAARPAASDCSVVAETEQQADGPKETAEVESSAVIG